MTAALLPLAASSLLALTTAAPMHSAAPSGSSAHEAPQQSQGQAHQGPQGQQGQNARTAPPSDRGGSSQHAAPPASNGGRQPPPRAENHQRPAGYGPPARPPSRPVHYAAPPPHYAPPAHVYSYGVFVYSPPPPPPRGARGHAPSGKSQAPSREVNRDDSFAVGIRSGSLASGYEYGAGYSDFGVGLDVRYRPTEALGLEVSYGYYSDSFNDQSKRTIQPMSASVEAFAFPWTRVSPYALAGVTWTERDIQGDETGELRGDTFTSKDLQFGPHVGLGLEVAVGKQAAIDLEGRYSTYVTKYDDDPSLRGSLQGTLALNMYF